MPTFDRTNLPTDTPVEWVDALNDGVDRLRERKLTEIAYNEPTHFEFVGRWIDIYLQAQIRRGLSLIDGGLAEIQSGRTIVAAFCSRALIEDAASLWIFIQRINELLDEGDSAKLDDYLFSKALATRLPHVIKRWGEEYQAVNILNAIDRMTVEHPNVRPMYDQLSDVCHPNQFGVLWHFAGTPKDGRVTFDDGARMTDAALGSLIFASIMFVGEEPAIARLELRLDKLCGHETF